MFEDKSSSLKYVCISHDVDVDSFITGDYL